MKISFKNMYEYIIKAASCNHASVSITWKDTSGSFLEKQIGMWQTMHKKPAKSLFCITHIDNKPSQEIQSHPDKKY